MALSLVSESRTTKKRPTKRAPDAGDSVASYSFSCAASLFPVGRLRRPQPPAQVTQTVETVEKGANLP
jgi:hypothetical protein